ncbi:MFS transporter, partial [Acidimicrobiaceae bacterium USS-CC1]|nr:MFS transporter [Acidiferrimicrobium australe]
MSLFSGAAAYTRLLRLPDARRIVVASCICRLSYGMLSLALLLVVEHATGSFAAAGTAGAAFSLAALTAPAKARFIGSRPRRWGIGGLGAAYGASLLALVALGIRQVGAPLPFVALSATAGLATVPIGPMMRARWARVAAPEERRRAYALDVALEDS